MRRIGTAAIAGALGLLSAAAHAQTYSLKLIDPSASWRSGIMNDSGQIAFTKSVCAQGRCIQRAYRYDGSEHDLFPNDLAAETGVSYVNGNGTVAGQNYSVRGFGGYVWMPQLGRVDFDLIPFALNSADDVMLGYGGGGASVPGGNNAVLWSPTRGLRDTGYWTNPILLGESGAIVGAQWGAVPIGSGYFRSVIHVGAWSDAKGRFDIGGLASITSPTAISRSDQIVGAWSEDFSSFYSAGRRRAFSWTTDGGFVDLGESGGSVKIDDQGGVFFTSQEPAELNHVVRWTRDGGKVDLDGRSGGVSSLEHVHSTGVAAGAASRLGSTQMTGGFVWSPTTGWRDFFLERKSIQTYAREPNSAAQVAFREAPQRYEMTPWYLFSGQRILRLGDVISNATGIVVTWVWSLTENGSMLVQTTAGFGILTPDVPFTPPAAGQIAVGSKAASINQSVSMSAGFTDANVEEIHIASWRWGDGSADSMGTIVEDNGSGSTSASHSYSRPGIYRATLTVTDNSRRSDSASRDVVVFDPSSGYVAGSGSISSAGSRATFAVVSGYDGKGSGLKGTTQFRFNAPGFDFAADKFESLVVGGSRATLKGSGRVNGSDHKFTLTAIDGELPGGGGKDRLRLRIWKQVGTSGEAVIYDNNADAEVDGSIVIQAGKK